ncbi:MAG: 30S ribosomal protein S10 [Cenarchaeum sp. SB0665_bin_23]|nr:30S ribosomal protein S10 [Cenarchaeum sp. SB0667_bin_13]MXY61112.1 30S ribosomal protein S10 [Cenarchaeum sp. SB0665_bin_23]MXZ93019.1 30S ribosomal protein S10 [Cenarchaeum sp. SB0666_bin_15]MYB47285.1 30S ribosomal protein S10 [Cenarchaeum sp. SB0662_bin_33]MYC79648.1 30S ribosomal protein S10 [Cenarchaeum sp. SB0661_bin_35]MYD58604.1 30S ribosomal protein S10 [Cenarchaeum sp. SB0678_bin_8]MYG33080.1 30S ribosomal protein S10 [Cenarchaeum sp. SB0677_bin_16]MYJ27903.1 30S ribosomal prot
MAQTARVKLTSISLPKLNGVCGEIMGIGKNTGVRIKGPTPLPIKRLHVATRKSPCGNGTETYEKWEMRLHRRVIDISADDKVIRQLMRLRIPDDVYIELLLT